MARGAPRALVLASILGDWHAADVRALVVARALARFAVPSAVVTIGVLVVVWMPVGAVRDQRPLATDVLADRDGLQVRRLDAVLDAAQMIDRQAARDRADPKLVGDPVCLLHGAAYLHQPVAVPVVGGCPDQALARPL